MKKIVFVDRDGTIVREPRDKQVDSLDKLEFIPGIISGLKLLRDFGFSLVMVTNQDGLGTPSYPTTSFQRVQKKILTLLTGEGIMFEKVFICPHRPGDRCSCRKPRTGLVDNYLRRVDMNRTCSFVLGDRETDVLFAKELGIRAVRITRQSRTGAVYSTPDAYAACSYIVRDARTGTINRSTAETRITATVALDGTGKYTVHTGLRFLDHMLEQLARHSGIDIRLSCRGDLDVDEHHTVEDTGIALGTAIRNALGDKRGIERFGFHAPLDEAVAHVVIDLSGRTHVSFDAPFRRERVGDLPTELVEDFFRAFASGLRATLHVRCGGRNDHHMIESIFKATARALKNAVRLDVRASGAIPSTKGLL